ncbi:hypothetical protein CDAR_376071 [Caerostris darwini]|uniref:Uncharacterized protein n=1 Tax=Caerostris darwini TaxID=1538125 RepID=A0AAV4UI03_9ARAC|nr:hypothetical protein CDAR_376071 [Caerostris darwini]
MQECSFKIIRSIIKLLAAITVVEIPHTQPSLITKFSFGEKIVWCSTTPQIEWVTVPIHVVEGEIPVVTDIISIRRKPAKYVEKVTPTTTSYKRITKEIYEWFARIPRPATRVAHYPIIPKVYEGHITPTTVGIWRIEPEPCEFEDYIPVPHPEHVHYTVQPGFMQERKTPAPVIKEVYQIPKRRYWESIPPVQTEVYRQTPRRQCNTIEPYKNDVANILCSEIQIAKLYGR